MRTEKTVASLRRALQDRGAAGYIAESVGLAPSTVRRIAAGSIKSPTVETIRMVERGLKLYRGSDFCRALATLRRRQSRRRAV